MQHECDRCGTLFSVGLASCPHCGNDYKEPDMAKAHAHRPPSDVTKGTEILESGGPDDTGTESKDSGPVLPGNAAKKPEWVAFAVSLGKDETDAEALTIAELQGWAEAELAIGDSED